MPLYYFHLRSHDENVLDEEGSDLPDLDAAIAEAEQGARDIAADQLRRREPVDGRRIEVTDAAGTILTTVMVRDVLD